MEKSELAQHRFSFLGVCRLSGDKDVYMWEDIETGGLNALNSYDEFINYIQRMENLNVILEGTYPIDVKTIPGLFASEINIYKFEIQSDNMLEKIIDQPSTISEIFNYPINPNKEYLAVHVRFH